MRIKVIYKDQTTEEYRDVDYVTVFTTIVPQLYINFTYALKQPAVINLENVLYFHTEKEQIETNQIPVALCTTGA